MSSRKNQVYDVLVNAKKPLSASDIADQIDVERSNVSRYLKELHQENKIESEL